MVVYGNLPSEGQLADWEFSVSQHSAVPQGILVSSSLAVFIFLQLLNETIFFRCFLFTFSHTALMWLRVCSNFCLVIRSAVVHVLLFLYLYFLTYLDFEVVSIICVICCSILIGFVFEDRVSKAI